MYQGSCDRDALLLPAGELSGKVVGAVRYPEGLHHDACASLGLAPGYIVQLEDQIEDANRSLDQEQPDRRSDQPQDPPGRPRMQCPEAHCPLLRRLASLRTRTDLPLRVADVLGVHPIADGTRRGPSVACRARGLARGEQPLRGGRREGQSAPRVIATPRTGWAAIWRTPITRRFGTSCRDAKY